MRWIKARYFERQGLRDWVFACATQPLELAYRPMLFRLAGLAIKRHIKVRSDAYPFDSAWTESGGTRLVKSHDWAYMLSNVQRHFPNDWIMLVYRPDMASYAWWHEAGGFQIKYPCYDAYQDSMGMLAAITRQNQCILEYAHSRNATWHSFTSEWVESTFGHQVEIKKTFPDILVTVFK